MHLEVHVSLMCHPPPSNNVSITIKLWNIEKLRKLDATPMNRGLSQFILKWNQSTAPIAAKHFQSRKIFLLVRKVKGSLIIWFPFCTKESDKLTQSEFIAKRKHIVSAQNIYIVRFFRLSCPWYGTISNIAIKKWGKCNDTTIISIQINHSLIIIRESWFYCQGIFSLCVGTLIKMKKWAVNSLRMDLKGIEREAAWS